MNDRFRLGHLWRIRNRPQLALGCYRAAALESPTFTAAWVAWADVLVTLGAPPEEIVEVYRQAASHNPLDIGLSNTLAHLGRTFGEPPEKASPPSRPERLLLWTDCPGYGAGEVSHSILSAWHDAGFRVTMVQPELPDRLFQERVRRGLKHVFTSPDNLYDLTQTPAAFTNHQEVQKILAQEQPDLILFADGCPFSNLAAKEVAAAGGFLSCAVVHAVQPQWATDYAPFAARLRDRYAELDVKVVCQDNLELLRLHFGLPPDRGDVIYNGRPPRFFAPIDEVERTRRRTLLGVADSDLLVLTTASLESRKGYPYLVDCVRELRLAGIHFAWAGRGTLEAQLREHTFGLPVSFLGEVDDVDRWLDACDVFLLPSVWEGMPLSILEAMAKGRAVVASRISGIPEALGEGGQLLFPPNLDEGRTKREILECLLHWRAHPADRIAHGQQGRQRALQLFQEGTMQQDYLTWSKDILGRKRRAQPCDAP